jgi:hypothetical protein
MAIVTLFSAIAPSFSTVLLLHLGVLLTQIPRR